MRIRMKDWTGVKVPADYVTKMVRSAIAAVTSDDEPEPLSYVMTGDTLVLSVNDGAYPEVYVCKIVRYGCPAQDEIEIIDA
jgi:hypothetical protein